MKKEITQKDFWYFIEKKEMPDLLNHTVISPMHYGDTIEIHLNCGFEGEAIINGQHYPFKEKNVFFVPPNALHTYIYTKGGAKPGDRIGAFHINVEMLRSILDVENLLFLDGHTLSSYRTAEHDFDQVWEVISKLLDPQRPFIKKTSDLLQLFDTLNHKSDIQSNDTQYNPAVIRIVKWVEQSYAEKLTVEQAAKHFGFSTYYFCKWFKTQTGITFNEYLNAVRITHACVYLQNGDSVAATSEQCGFSDPSYFTKVFKRFLGITPNAYTAKPKSTSRRFLN